MKILVGADIVPKSKEVEQLFIDGDIKTLFGDVCELYPTWNATNK